MSSPERGSHIHDEEGRISDPSIAHEMAKAEDPHLQKKGLFGKVKGTKEGERAAVEVGVKYERAFKARDRIVDALKEAAKNKKGIKVWTLDYTNTDKLAEDRLQIQVDAQDPSYPNTPGTERPVVQVYIYVGKEGQEIHVHHGAYGKDADYSLDQIDKAIEDAVSVIRGGRAKTKKAA